MILDDRSIFHPILPPSSPLPRSTRSRFQLRPPGDKNNACRCAVWRKDSTRSRWNDPRGWCILYGSIKPVSSEFSVLGTRGGRSTNAERKVWKDNFEGDVKFLSCSPARIIISLSYNLFVVWFSRATLSPRRIVTILAAVFRVTSVHVTSNQFAFSVTTTRVQRCSLYSLARVSRKSFRPGRDGDPEIRETLARHHARNVEQHAFFLSH